MIYDGGLQDEARAIAANYRGEAFIAGVSRNVANPDYLVLKQSNPYILVPAPLTPAPQGDATRMNVTWRSNTAGTSFRLERTPGPVLPTSVWTVLTTAPPGTTSFLDSGLSAGTSYCYRIYAFTGSLSSRTITNCATTTLGAPTLSPLTVDTTTQITLAWSQVAGNTGYRVERRIGAGSWTDLVDKGADATSHIDGGLTAGTTYSYRVSTLSPPGPSLPSNTQTAATLPMAPAMTANGSVTAVSAVLNWTNVAGETGYRLERKTGSNGTWSEIATTGTDQLTYTDSGLTADSQYYYRVRAYNGSGTSVYSGEQGVLTRFTAPTLLSAVTAAADKIDLAWTNVVGNTGYVVQSSPCNYNNNPTSTASLCGNGAYYTSWSNTATLPADTVSYQVTGLATGNGYQYRIVATTAGNSSDASNAIIAWTALTPPTATIVPASETSLTINWNDIVGESNFTLEGRLGSGSIWTEIAGAVDMAANTVTKTVTGLELSTEYCYRIKARTSNANGPPPVLSNEPCLYTPLPAPTLSTPTGTTDQLTNLSWSNISGNTGYELQRCTFTQLDNPENAAAYLFNDSYWNNCTTIPLAVDTTSYQSVGLAAGYTYRYRVRDTYSGGVSAWSTPQAVTTIPPTPTITSATALASSQIGLGFSSGYGETGLRLEWKVRSGSDCSAGAWSTTVSVGENQTSMTHGSLAAGTWYCYRLYAVNSAGNSGYSAERSQTTLADAPTLNPPTSVTTNQVVLTWNTITGNNGYVIERKTGTAGSWSAIHTTAADAVTYTNSGLTAGTLYSWRISTVNAGGASVPSSPVTTVTTANPPTVAATTVSEDRIDLAWSVMPGATHYKIERQEGEGSYTEISNQAVSYSESYCGNSYATMGCPNLTAAATSYSDSSLIGNTIYCYRLRSWNVTGGDSVYSTERCATTLAIPAQSLTATALNAFKIRLDWTPVVCTPNPCDPPEGYEIERLVRDGNWVKIATVDAGRTSFTDRIAIDPLRQYRYRIRSYTGALRSPYAEAATYTPPYQAGDNVGP
jgi:hypothetical protein